MAGSVRNCGGVLLSAEVSGPTTNLMTCPVVAGWAKKAGFTFPVLLDADGSVAESYAPAGVLPDLPRNQVVIASNLLIDRAGRAEEPLRARLPPLPRQGLDAR